MEPGHHLISFENDDGFIRLNCSCGWGSRTAPHVDPDILKMYAQSLETRHLRLNTIQAK